MPPLEMPADEWLHGSPRRAAFPNSFQFTLSEGCVTREGMELPGTPYQGKSKEE